MNWIPPIKISKWNIFVTKKCLQVFVRVQCRTQSIFEYAVYLCYCKLRLVIPPWWGLRGWKFLILITLDRCERHFQEKNYIENYFYVLKSTKSSKTTSQKCWRGIIWVDFFGCPYRTNYQNTSGFAAEV